MINRKIKMWICLNLSDLFKMFEDFQCFENVFVCCWCVLYSELIFLMRLSDSVSFSVYMNMFKTKITFLGKVPDV